MRLRKGSEVRRSMSQYNRHVVIVVGEPICSLVSLGLDQASVTLRTDERFLPRALVDAGVFSSYSEIRRNRPELIRDLETIGWDSFRVGKTVVDVVIGR
jgi:hypothetical protein